MFSWAREGLKLDSGREGELSQGQKNVLTAAGSRGEASGRRAVWGSTWQGWTGI